MTVTATASGTVCPGDRFCPGPTATSRGTRRRAPLAAFRSLEPPLGFVGRVGAGPWVSSAPGRPALRDGRARLRGERRPARRQRGQLHGHRVMRAGPAGAMATRTTLTAARPVSWRRTLGRWGTGRRQRKGNFDRRRRTRTATEATRRPARRRRRTETGRPRGSRALGRASRADDRGLPGPVARAPRIARAAGPGAPRRATKAALLARSTSGCTKKNEPIVTTSAAPTAVSSRRSRGGEPPAATTSPVAGYPSACRGIARLEVVGEGERGREHADHDEPPPARLVDRGEDEQLAEEAARQREPGHREHEPPHATPMNGRSHRARRGFRA